MLPLLVPVEGGRGFHNRAYLLLPDGTVGGLYNKVHETVYEIVDLGVVAGNIIGVFPNVF